MAAEGLVTFELKEKLRTLEETRQLAEQELKALKVCQARLRGLEHDKDIFLEIYAHIVPETISTLTPEERHHICKMLRLKLLAYPDERSKLPGRLRAVYGWVILDLHV